MHYTLHLSAKCNMRCSYCYVSSNNKRIGCEAATIPIMSMDTARKAIDLAGDGAKSAGLIFFGGEPLLHKDIIFEAVSYARKKEKDNGCKYSFKITTNGLLLDDEFLEYAVRENFFISLSLDGTKEAHDAHRKDAEGSGTYESIAKAAKSLLALKPYSPVQMTVSPDTLNYYAVGIDELYSLGFKYIMCSLDYSAKWRDSHMRELRRQYELMADFYYRHSVAEDMFYLSPFEVKISSHINKDNFCRERCELGKRQLSVAPDGKIYPCLQFVGDEKYVLGNVNDTPCIDEQLRMRLYEENEAEKPSCKKCAIRMRCNHFCSCLNMQTTGNIHEVSPVLCAHERIVLPIADRLASKLYKERNAQFIHKAYNDFFPLIAQTADKAFSSGNSLGHKSR